MGLKVALIGSGAAGKVHLEAFSSHPAVTSISLAETDHDQVELLTKNISFDRVERDYRSLLSDPGIAVVDICLPHDLHYPVAMQAFEAHKDVILEKPISITVEEADAMIAAAKRAGKRLYVALNERFLPLYQKVKQVVQSGDLGKITMASFVVAGSELPRMNQIDHWKGTFGRSGGGALADSGTHVVDQAIDWFGLPESVTCCMGRFIVGPVNKADDTACLTLLYPDKIVNILVCYATNGQSWSETRSIWGEKGTLEVRVENEQPIHLVVDHQSIDVPLKHHAETWWVDSVRNGILHAVDCLVSGSPFAVTPEDARDVLRVIRAGYSSAALNRQVRLSEAEPSPLYTLRSM